MFIPNRESLAWAAGFFDGEGSISCYIKSSRPNQKRIHICIGQTDIRPLDRFKLAVMNIGVIGGPYKNGRKKDKEIYQYHTHTYSDSIAVIAMLWKYLSEPKRIQAHNAFTDFHKWYKEAHRIKLWLI